MKNINSAQYSYNKMKLLISKYFNLNTVFNFRRYLHGSVIKKSYEGSGKTSVTFLSKDADYGLMITGYSPVGFTLNTGMRVYGPMIIFPKTVLGWNVPSSQEITEESLVLFTVLEPKLEILIIGMDDNYTLKEPSIQIIKGVLKNANINYEILPVGKACSSFNFLNSDERYVAAALIPPKVKQISAVTAK